MRKEKMQILIPFSLTSIYLLYCWVMLFINDYIPTWKHYTTLVLFVVVSVLFVRRQIASLVIALGVYLLLASFHIISLSYQQATFFFGPDSPYNPHFQLMSIGIFIVYISLNLNHLFDIELDWKEKGR